MISWAEIDSRVKPAKRKCELREYAQMELGGHALPNLVARIFVGVAAQAGQKKRVEAKKGRGISEAHIENSQPTSTK